MLRPRPDFDMNSPINRKCLKIKFQTILISIYWSMRQHLCTPRSIRSQIPLAPDNSGLHAKLSSADYQSLYLKPFHAAQVVDPLLSDVKISLWTAVCDDNMLMRDLLAVFFRCKYHFTAVFQKDYFLKDITTKRNDFRSSLLVNAVLAYACRIVSPGILKVFCLIWY
jgi:hypothetical protein